MVVWAPRRLARAAYWCREFCPRGFALWGASRAQLFAGVAQQLAASTACIGSELWLASRAPKKVEKSKQLAHL